MSPARARGELPEILEVKRTLQGKVKEFPCRLVERGPAHAVLLYVSTAAMALHGVELPLRTVTFAYYWTDRPWNVYHWLDEGGTTIAHYVNIADETFIQPSRLEWRDLAVDILATPAGRLEILDRDELPDWLPVETRAMVDRAVGEITAAPATFFGDIERRTRELWPAVFGGRR